MGEWWRVHTFFQLQPTMSLEDKFKEAADTISNKIKKTMIDDELKEVYGLYKQATKGDVNIDKPGMLDLKGGAKWEARKSKEGTSKEDAMQKYIDFAASMVEKHGLA